MIKGLNVLLTVIMILILIDYQSLLPPLLALLVLCSMYYVLYMIYYVANYNSRCTWLIYLLLDHTGDDVCVCVCVVLVFRSSLTLLNTSMFKERFATCVVGVRR